MKRAYLKIDGELVPWVPVPELRERLLSSPVQEAGRFALMRGNIEDATVAERVETITRAMLDTLEDSDER